MSISEITVYELRRMEDQEGLVLQGCGGPLQDWLDGINSMLTRVGILKYGTQFENISTFQKDGATCLLFPFDQDVQLDMGKLAVWRLQTHSDFGSTWLSDYVPNYLGGFVQEQEQQPRSQQKPDCPLIGADGNIFNLMGIVSRTLKEHGLADQAQEMRERITQSGSYGAALCIIGEYVNVTAAEQTKEMDMQMQ